MIATIEQLNANIAENTKKIEDKLTGADGKRHIVLCGGTGCLSSHSSDIAAKFQTLLAEQGLDDKVTVNMVGCFGFCSQGPFVKIYPEDTLYRLVKLEDVEDIIETDYNGDEFKIAFNYKLVSDFLKVVDCDNVTLGLNSNQSAAVFRPFNDEDYVYLVMPMKI